MSRYIVTVRAPDGKFDVTQAESREEAKQMQQYAEENYPEVEVEIRPSRTGLAILEGMMDELLR